MKSYAITIQMKPLHQYFSHGTIYLGCSSNFWVCGWNPVVLPFKWNRFGSTLHIVLFIFRDFRKQNLNFFLNFILSHLFKFSVNSKAFWMWFSGEEKTLNECLNEEGNAKHRRLQSSCDSIQYCARPPRRCGWSSMRSTHISKFRRYEIWKGTWLQRKPLSSHHSELLVLVLTTVHHRCGLSVLPENGTILAGSIEKHNSLSPFHLFNNSFLSVAYFIQPCQLDCVEIVKVCSDLFFYFYFFVKYQLVIVIITWSWKH